MIYIYMYIYSTYTHTHAGKVAREGCLLATSVAVRDLLSEGSFVVGNISGLPDSPVTDVTFENVAARNNHRGIQCSSEVSWGLEEMEVS